MASSSKFDLSSGSPDRPLYSSGQRGPHTAIPMDRSGSFRESMEPKVSSSLPAVLRNGSAVAQTDVLNFFQCLPFDSKLLALDYKSNRLGDLKGNVAAALGFSPDSPSNILKGKLIAPPSQEELKRLKLGLREYSGKARERVKTFSEALSLLNKSFPSLPTKKRSRSDVFSNDRSGPLLTSDGPMQRQGLGKAGQQNNIIPGGFENEVQKSEERTKKRPRALLADVKLKGQGHIPMKASGPVDRERDLPKSANTSSAQCDDRSMPTGVDGWEKSKTKKKRSVIKPDASLGTISTKPVDSQREKQGIQQRSINDGRPRLNSEAHGFRQGFINGAPGVGRREAISQQTSLSARVSSPKVDQDGSSLAGDRRDRPMNSDNERLNLKATNKSNFTDDFDSASPTSSTRMNASVRGPRSNSGSVPKLSRVMNGANTPIDYEIPHNTNRPPAVVGANNRKRSASVRSSSPPASQLTAQHQKNSRTARRTNFGPSVSSNDEGSPLDAEIGGNQGGLGNPRRLSAGSPQLVKLKGELLSSSTLSEGEDSGAPEIKSRDGIKKFDEVDEKSGQHVHKVFTSVVSSRKNKIVSGEDCGYGIRKQGRSGRGFTSARSFLPVRGEKLGNEETGKQLRAARPALDKAESKAGRPSTRKLSDRKAYPRQRHTSINAAAANFLVGLDDGHDELLAAANAVIKPSHEFLKSIWKEMEPLFGFISDVDIEYLKEQGSLGFANSTPELDVPVDTDDLSIRNGFGLCEGEIRAGDPTRVSLFERCLSALIPEEEVCSITSDDFRHNTYGSGHELSEELESNGYICEPAHQDISGINGYKVTGKSGYQLLGNNMVSIIRAECNPGVDGSINSLVTDRVLAPVMCSSQSLHESMDINKKLMLELQSIDIFPEAMLSREGSEGAEIDCEIDELMEKYRVQVSKKKGLLDRILKCAMETKESQDREFEQLALDKLVGMAYEKYMVFWGSAGGKTSSNKMAKQASLAFVKRSLDRCKQVEEMEKSCFSDPKFRDIFHSESSRLSLARLTASTSLGSPSMSEQGKEDAGPNRAKKRELLLEEVVGGNPSALLSSSTKGKRSERDRDGKGHNKEVLSRNGNTKSGRTAVSNAKGERKSKAKPRQKTTQLSASFIGNSSDQSKPVCVSGSKSTEQGNSKEKLEYEEQLEEPLDFSQLQLPGIDELGVADDLGGQAQDLASWLNFDDDNLQDHDDFMGLEIPMDDLSDLNMMV